jgi:hypothetical protein
MELPNLPIVDLSPLASETVYQTQYEDIEDGTLGKY